MAVIVLLLTAAVLGMIALDTALGHAAAKRGGPDKRADAAPRARLDTLRLENERPRRQAALGDWARASSWEVRALELEAECQILRRQLQVKDRLPHSKDGKERAV